MVPEASASPLAWDIPSALVEAGTSEVKAFPQHALPYETLDAPHVRPSREVATFLLVACLALASNVVAQAWVLEATDEENPVVLVAPQ